jgi:hypothetical protein
MVPISQDPLPQNQHECIFHEWVTCSHFSLNEFFSKFYPSIETKHVIVGLFEACNNEWGYEVEIDL